MQPHKFQGSWCCPYLVTGSDTAYLCESQCTICLIWALLGLCPLTKGKTSSFLFLRAYESKAYGVLNHNLKLQSMKFSITRDIPSFPVQG